MDLRPIKLFNWIFKQLHSAIRITNLDGFERRWNVSELTRRSGAIFQRCHLPISLGADGICGSSIHLNWRLRSVPFVFAIVWKLHVNTLLFVSENAFRSNAIECFPNYFPAYEFCRFSFIIIFLLSTILLSGKIGYKVLSRKINNNVMNLISETNPGCSADCLQLSKENYGFMSCSWWTFDSRAHQYSTIKGQSLCKSLSLITHSTP